MAHDLSFLTEQVTRLLQIQAEQVTRMKRLEVAMMGDDELGHEGFVKQQHRFNAMTTEHAELVATWKAKMTGAFLAATGLGAFINWLFNLRDVK